MGVGRGDLGLSWILKLDIFLLHLKQKRLFSESREGKIKFHHFCPSRKKNLCLPLENILPTPMESEHGVGARQVFLKV